MCFCNTYQYLMRKEISGSLFRETPTLYFGAPFVFQLWVMLSKDECYNQYPMKNSALYLYPPSHLSQPVIPIKNICYSHEKAVFYDTRPPIIAQGHDGRFLVLGMYTMHLSFAFTFLLVSGAAFYALLFYLCRLPLRHLSYTSLYVRNHSFSPHPLLHSIRKE